MGYCEAYCKKIRRQMKAFLSICFSVFLLGALQYRKPPIDPLSYAVLGGGEPTPNSNKDGAVLNIMRGCVSIQISTKHSKSAHRIVPFSVGTSGDVEQVV